MAISEAGRSTVIRFEETKVEGIAAPLRVTVNDEVKPLPLSRRVRAVPMGPTLGAIRSMMGGGGSSWESVEFVLLAAFTRPLMAAAVSMGTLSVLVEVFSALSAELSVLSAASSVSSASGVSQSGLVEESAVGVTPPVPPGLGKPPSSDLKVAPPQPRRNNDTHAARQQRLKDR